MRLFRVRIRTMMIAIALLGIVIAGAVQIAQRRRLRSEYQQNAAYHASQAANFQRCLALAHQGSAIVTQAASRAERFARTNSKVEKDYRAQMRDYRVKMIAYYDRQISGYQRRADYHAGLARKYTDAFNHPWRILPPDPPQEDPLGVSLLLGQPEAPDMPLDF